jgi:Fe-S-cluster containining protein
MVDVLHDAADARVAAAFKAFRVTVACKRGCASCCWAPVTSTIAEVWGIVQELRTWASPERAAVRARLDNALAGARERRIDLREAVLGRAPKHPDRAEAARLVALERARHAPTRQAAAYMEAGLPCPFLTGNECGIYAFRPMRCRMHFSAERDAAPCEVRGGIVVMPDTKQPETEAIEVALVHVEEVLGNGSDELRESASRQLMVALVPANLLLLLDAAWFAVEDATVEYERMLPRVEPLARWSLRALAEEGLL